jgi:hypothetical protein
MNAHKDTRTKRPRVCDLASFACGRDSWIRSSVHSEIVERAMRKFCRYATKISKSYLFTLTHSSLGASTASYDSMRSATTDSCLSFWRCLIEMLTWCRNFSTLSICTQQQRHQQRLMQFHSDYWYRLISNFVNIDLTRLIDHERLCHCKRSINKQGRITCHVPNKRAHYWLARDRGFENS